MKVIIPRRSEQGAIILLFILFILFLVLIGTLAYVIWKAIDGLPDRPDSDEDDTAFYEGTWRGDLEDENQGTNLQIYTLGSGWSEYQSDEPAEKPSFVPQGILLQSTGCPVIFLERSTNLVYWLEIGCSTNDSMIDTNPPSQCGFYRMRYQ